MPRPTGLEPPSDVRVAFTVPAWATANVKELEPPTGRVPVKLWDELDGEALSGDRRLLISPHPVLRTIKATRATPEPFAGITGRFIGLRVARP
jgi:hypothetical protein